MEIEEDSRYLEVNMRDLVFSNLLFFPLLPLTANVSRGPVADASVRIVREESWELTALSSLYAHRLHS